MAQSKKQKSDQYFEDEIDLSPYINRLVAKKWWILGITVLVAGIAYGVSYFLPKRYRVNASITFSGGEVTAQEDSTTKAEEIVSPTYVTEMAGKFLSNRKEAGEAEGLISMTAEGKTYPLSIIFIIKDGIDKNLYHNDFLSYLNTNSYVAAELEAEQKVVSDNIDVYEVSIESLDDEISKVESQLNSTDGNPDLVSSYADLISVRNNLMKEKRELEKHLASLQGFKFAVRPYYANGGSPAFPKKTQNAAIAGFVALILVSGVVAFRKDASKK